MISIRNLTKRYGSLLALDDLTMEIPAGEMLGLIGPNGAGKTTTIKILATLLNATRGSATIDGHSVKISPAAVRQSLGYMPDFCGVYEDMRVREYLVFFAATYGLRGKKALSTVDDVLSLTELTGKADAMADSLSRGMQQRLQLARVLLHDPKVLLLDEPASGLDPRARVEMRVLLQELGNMGKTILISSHILSELAELCTSIAIIEEGKLVYHGNVEEAISKTRGHGGNCIIVAVTERTEEARELLLAQDDIEDVIQRDGSLEIGYTGDWSTERVFDLMMEHGFRLRRLEDEQVSLEDAFMHLTEGRVS